MRRRHSKGKAERTAKYSREARAEKVRAYERKRGQVRPPAITENLAGDVAKMLMAGIPIGECLEFVDPDYPKLEPEQRARCERTWLNSPLLFAANTKLLGGEWQSMDKDARLAVALDKHLAELAYLLYSKSYIECSGDVSRRMDAARSAITDWISKSEGATDTPWIRALKDIIEGKISGQPIAAGSPVVLPLHLEKH